MPYRGLFIGLTTIDIQYFVDEFPERNTKIKTKAPDILVGGPATNAAVAFSYLNNGAHLATVVGENSFTQLIKSDFIETKIELIDVVEGQILSPVIASVITSGNGDRNIFTHTPAVIQPEISPNRLFDLVKPEIVLLDGFYPEFSLECAKLARLKNIPVVIDGGSWKSQYMQLLKYADVVICSSDFFPSNCENPDEVFDFLKTMGVCKMVISRGEQNILFKQNETKGEVSVNGGAVVDTLGAGDFLHGAFCYYYLESGDFKLALQKSAQLASFTCGFKGTRNWLKN